MLQGYRGHAHFWERALSRRQFVRTAAGASVLAMGASLAWPMSGFTESEDLEKQVNPNPILGGTNVVPLLGLPPGPPLIFHFFFPVFGNEVSTITDFNGSIAAAEIQGSGFTDKQTTLFYDADMRFMSGQYVGVDGRAHEGSFGFV